MKLHEWVAAGAKAYLGARCNLVTPLKVEQYQLFVYLVMKSFMILTIALVRRFLLSTLAQS